VTLARVRTRRLLSKVIYALVRLIYRLRIQGRENVPRHGAALMVCNHVSYMDALVLGGACPRPIRFVMDQTIFKSPVLQWWFKWVGVIPIASERRDPGSLRRALDDVSAALANGEIVMVFPEGRLTRDGEVGSFRRGIETILARDNVPVVPVGLAGLWGSWTSNANGPALKKWPRRWRARVTLNFGKALDPLMISKTSGHEIALRRYLETQVRSLKEAAQQGGQSIT